MFGQKQRTIRHLTRQLEALMAFGTEMYDFVVAELDPDPHVAEAYVTSDDGKRGARIVQRVSAAKAEGV